MSFSEGTSFLNRRLPAVLVVWSLQNQIFPLQSVFAKTVRHDIPATELH
jgi:hypothetical protein